MLLTDAHATAVSLKTALKQLARSVRQDVVAILYFSGPGAQENDETYFLTSDAVEGNLYATAVNFNDIRTAMRILVDKHCRVVVFMDACHAGALYNTKSISRTLQFANPASSVSIRAPIPNNPTRPKSGRTESLPAPCSTVLPERPATGRATSPRSNWNATSKRPSPTKPTASKRPS